MIYIHTENQNQRNFYPFVLLKISVLHEFLLEHLHYNLTDVLSQLNFLSDNVFNSDQSVRDLNVRN